MAVGRRTFSAAFKAECVAMYRDGHSFVEISKAKELAGRHPAPTTVKDWVFSASARVKKGREAGGDTEAMVRRMAGLAGEKLSLMLEAETDTEKLIKAVDVLTKRVIEFEKRGLGGGDEREPEEIGTAPEGPGAA